MKSANFSINSDERVCILGKTGSGKTFLARRLLKSCKRLLILDSKATLTDWSTVTLAPSSEGVFDIADYADKEGNFRLRLVDMQFDMQTIEYFYSLGDTTIYIDESYSVFSPSRKRSELEPILRALTRGRERGIGVWVSSQRPAWMSTYVLTEAEHFFVFRLTDESDRTRVSKSIHEDMYQKTRDRHGFFYYDVYDDRPTYFQKI